MCSNYRKGPKVPDRDPPRQTPLKEHETRHRTPLLSQEEHRTRQPDRKWRSTERPPLPREQNDWHTPVKILPCPKLRLWAVKMEREYACWSQRSWRMKPVKSKTPEATGRVQLQHLHHLQRVTAELHKHPHFHSCYCSSSVHITSSRWSSAQIKHWKTSRWLRFDSLSA